MRKKMQAFFKIYFAKTGADNELRLYQRPAGKGSYEKAGRGSKARAQKST